MDSQVNFTKYSFCKTMNENGTAYQRRAMELIRICRLLSMVAEQSPRRIHRLQSVLEACDTALAHAAYSRKKLLNTTDHEITKAKRKLLEYERDFPRDFHAIDLNVEDSIRAANDKDSKNRWDRIRPTDPTLRIVKFHILQDPSDRNPITVKQALISTSGLPEILWNFSRVQPAGARLTLAQNPHFYKGPPTGPTFPIIYGPASELHPTEEFHSIFQSTTEEFQLTFNILTNNKRWIFLELGQNWRTFDNVWRADNNTLFFKNFIGNLVGEAIVGNAITPPPLFWYQMERDEDLGFLPEPVGHIEDWRAPIHYLWNSSRICIHISINHHES